MKHIQHTRYIIFQISLKKQKQQQQYLATTTKIKVFFFSLLGWELFSILFYWVKSINLNVFFSIKHDCRGDYLLFPQNVYVNF